MSKRKALVTGGAGFIGSHLSNLLEKNKYDVIVYDDFSNGSGSKNLSPKIKIVKDNILNVKKFRAVCKKVDVVFNLAVKPLMMSFDKPDDVVNVNDYGTYLVAKTCTELQCKMIHVSSSEVYGTALFHPMKENHQLFPHTIYAASKASSELYVRGYHKSDGLEMVIIRPFNSYGEYMREDTYGAALPNFFNRISKGLPPIIQGSGKQTRDFTYVIDTCRGIMLADQSKKAISNTFNIGQGEEVSIKKIAEIMIKKYQTLTGKKIKQGLKFEKPRKGDVMRHLADISYAKKTIGYSPIVSIEEGIERYLKWKLCI